MPPRKRNRLDRAQLAPQIRRPGQSPLKAEMRRELGAVDSARWCHAELRLSTGSLQCVCRLAAGHDGVHEDGPTRWGESS